MISKCIAVMTTDIEGGEQSLSLKSIKDIAHGNINILIAGIENPSENVIFLLQFNFHNFT